MYSGQLEGEGMPSASVTAVAKVFLVFIGEGPADVGVIDVDIDVQRGIALLRDPTPSP